MVRMWKRWILELYLKVKEESDRFSAFCLRSSVKKSWICKERVNDHKRIEIKDQSQASQWQRGSAERERSWAWKSPARLTLGFY